MMASLATTRPGGFLVGSISQQISVSPTSESKEEDCIPSTLPRRYPVPQESPSPSPARKKVVFSSENLRYNKMMLAQARKRSRVSGSSARSRSKNKSPQKQQQLIAEHDDRSPSRGKAQPQRPPRSPAPIAIQLGTSVGTRGGLAALRVEIGTSTSKKRTLDAPPEIFASSKRRLMEHVSRSPSPHVSHRHYEHIALDNSEDELGQIDELGEPSSTPTRRLNLPTSSHSLTRQSPAHQFHSPQRQTGTSGKKVAFSRHDSNDHGNGGFLMLVSKARHVTPAPQTRVPKKRRALSVWQLATPPKVRTVRVPEAEVVDLESGDISDQSSGGEGRSEQGSRSVPQVKAEHEDKVSRRPAVTETAVPVPTIPSEASRERDDNSNNKRRRERKSEVRHAVRTAAPKSGQEPETEVVDNTLEDAGDTNRDKNGNDQADDPSERSPITMCGGRHYSEWTGTWDGEARKIPGAGALFPEGYEPLIGDPEPWICPIRDCQTVFPEAWALGGHFSASHRALLLNDNRDGTMSIFGKRKFPDPASGRMPALVVCRQPLDPTTAPPKAPPRKPGRRKKRGNRIPLSDVNPKRPKETPVPVPRPLSTPRPRSNSFLVIDLPSRRRPKDFDSPDKHSQAVLRPEKKTNTGANKDNIPDSSSSDKSIAHTPIRGSTEEEGGDVPVSSRAARAQEGQKPLSSSSKTVDYSRQTLASNTESTRRSGRLARPEPPPQPTQEASKRPSQAAASQSKKPARKQPASSASKLSQTTSHTTIESPRQSGGGGSLPPPYTMSDWEIAPGHIRVGSGDKSDNIAFSSTYLAHSSTSPLDLAPAISFQLLTIQPGSTVRWRSSSSTGRAEEEEPRTRICSVAQGIVKVKLCGQEFPVGPNGLFKVSTRQGCELSSVWYGGAVVHVTCVSEGDE